MRRRVNSRVRRIYASETDRAYKYVRVAWVVFYCGAAKIMATSDGSPICILCGFGSKLIDLEPCSMGHQMCRSCLKENAKKFGNNEMYTCPNCTAEAEDSSKIGNKPIWIFVDDSNIWIEAKKLAGRQKGLRTIDDHRLRIDVGKLGDVVAAGRPVVKGILYGSEPPKIDTVWKKIRECGWEVKTNEKSKITGKEKEVDGNIVADIMDIGYDTPEQDRSTIALISGDADMKPAIEKIIKKGWKVEIYMWAQGFSSRLKTLSVENSAVRCIELDDRLNEITFTNYRFSGKDIPRNSIILQMKPGVFPNRVPTLEWWRALEGMVQWSITGQWIEIDGKVTDDLVIVFDGHTEMYDSEGFVRDILSHKYNILFVRNVLTYLAYKGRHSIDVVRYIQSSTFVDDKSYVIENGKCIPYTQIQEYCQPEGIRSSESEIGESVAGFQQVFRRHTRSFFEEVCKHGKRCRRGRRCIHKHSREDVTYFERHGGKGNPSLKGAMCEQYMKNGKCSYGLNCGYAHGEADGWCFYCRVTGHLKDNCPKL